MEPSETPTEWVPISEASVFLGVPEGTLRSWRHSNVGPPSYKPGRAIQYKRHELAAWRAKREEVTRRGGKVVTTP